MVLAASDCSFAVSWRIGKRHQTIKNNVYLISYFLVHLCFLLFFNFPSILSNTRLKERSGRSFCSYLNCSGYCDNKFNSIIFILFSLSLCYVRNIRIVLSTDSYHLMYLLISLYMFLFVINSTNVFFSMFYFIFFLLHIEQQQPVSNGLESFNQSLTCHSHLLFFHVFFKCLLMS